MAISGVTDHTNTYAGYTNSADSKKQTTEGTGTATELLQERRTENEYQ